MSSKLDAQLLFRNEFTKDINNQPFGSKPMILSTPRENYNKKSSLPSFPEAKIKTK